MAPSTTARSTAPGWRRFASGRAGRISFDDGPGKFVVAPGADQPTQWSDLVASVCDVCGKQPGFGNKISHSHRRTRRRWNPNIQTVHTVVGGTPKRLKVCTSCIKAGKVIR